MTPRNAEDAYPLTPLQEGLLFERLAADGGEAVYGSQAVFLMEQLDREALGEAWQRVVDRHPVLRTAFAWQRTERPLQVVGRQARVPVDRADLTGMSADEQERHLEAFLAEDRRKGFTLS